MKQQVYFYNSTGTEKVWAANRPETGGKSFGTNNLLLSLGRVVQIPVKHLAIFQLEFGKLTKLNLQLLYLYPLQMDT